MFFYVVSYINITFSEKKTEWWVFNDLYMNTWNITLENIYVFALINYFSDNIQIYWDIPIFKHIYCDISFLLVWCNASFLPAFLTLMLKAMEEKLKTKVIFN